MTNREYCLKRGITDFDELFELASEDYCNFVYTGYCLRRKECPMLDDDDYDFENISLMSEYCRKCYEEWLEAERK